MKVLSISLLLFGGFFFIATVQNLYSQKLECNPVEIQEITLQDTFLVKQIGLFIDEESRTDPSFLKKGYVILWISEKPYMDDKVEKTYGLNKQFYNHDNLNNDLSFPPFYTFVKGRMVLVDIKTLDGTVCLKYTKKSKVAFQKKLEPFLAERVKMKFPDKDGKLRTVNNFRPGEIVQIHGGMTIYIFQDKNKAPVIEKNRY